MIWATVSSQSCFCWLYRASPSLAAKNIINPISILTIWWCPRGESSLALLEEGVCYVTSHNWPSEYLLLRNVYSNPLLFNRSFTSASLRPRRLQHTRLPCPSLSLRVCTNSCPLSWWCHPTISSSVIPYFSCLQSLPTSGSFSMSWLFASGGQSIGISASASVLSMNIQGWFLLGLTGLISLQSKGLSKAFSNTTICKHWFFGTQPSLWSNSHIHTWLLEKPQLELYRPWSAKGHVCFLRTSFPCSEETWSLVIKRMLLDPTPSWFGAPAEQPSAWWSVTRS